MGKGYAKDGGQARAAEVGTAKGLVGDRLEEIACEGAQRPPAESSLAHYRAKIDNKYVHPSFG